MDRPTALKSTVAGTALGGLVAGALWWLSVSPVVTAAAGVVWATAIGSTLYVFESYGGPTSAGPWGTVIGGSLLFNVVLSLSDLSLSQGAVAGLSVLAIGFTLLGYAAGMATVFRQHNSQETPNGTPTDASS